VRTISNLRFQEISQSMGQLGGKPQIPQSRDSSIDVRFTVNQRHFRNKRTTKRERVDSPTQGSLFIF